MYTSDRHLLPPSFERYFNSNHYAKVEYSIQAVFQFSDVQGPVTIQLPPLHFLPVSRLPDASTFVEYARPPEGLSTSRLTDKKRSFRLSYRGKGSSTPPDLTLVMKASLNNQVVRFSSFLVYACVEIYFDPDEAAPIPPITLRLTSVNLRQITAFRARLYSGASSTDEYQEMGEDTTTLYATPECVTAEARASPSGDGKSMFFPATFETRVPQTAQPSLRTFNINHSFQLRITFEVDVLGKKLEHKFVVENLVVLPEV
jgi:hypothetical protein